MLRPCILTLLRWSSQCTRPIWWLVRHGWTNGFAAAATNDGDGDGVPDGCDVCDGHDDNTDTDGDGRSDATEIADMTNLYDPNDYLRILSIDPHETCDPSTKTGRSPGGGQSERHARQRAASPPGRFVVDR